jgi:D-lyxose ketol-isomerase
MRRSEINKLLDRASAFFEEKGFRLPPMAAWGLEDWRAHAALAGEVFDRGLGWDLSDFGSGDFAHRGLVLYTLRNGAPEAASGPHGARGKCYAEKIMVVEESQVTPLHFHKKKTEDIINRGGGSLVFRLYRSDSAKGLSDEDLRLSVDGLSQVVHAGGLLALSPGESLCLEPGVYHEFWAEEAAVLAGEVSSVNDDATDNYFYQEAGRFPSIEEDEAPRYLLCTDYRRFIAAAAAP